MEAMRKLITIHSLTLAAIGVSLAAAAVLFSYPTNPLIWNAATWTLAAGLFVLPVLVLVSGYMLARNRTARTWQRIATFLLGLADVPPLSVAVGFGVRG
jgi:hypothetical protein